MSPKLMIKTNINSKPALAKNRGSALMVALFVMVVMVLFGTAFVKIIGANADTIAYEVIGTRSLQAAQSGAQIKLSELFPLTPNVGVCTNTPVYDFSNIKGLSGCKAIGVSCDLDTTVDGINYYTVISEGECRVADVVTSRTVKITVRDL